MRCGSRDELNYVFLPPAQLRDRIAEVRARCEAEGRDPATLRFSMYVRDEEMRPGPARVDALGTLRETELDRIVCFPGRWDPSPDGQAAFAEDCRAAGFVSAAEPRIVADATTEPRATRARSRLPHPADDPPRAAGHHARAAPAGDRRRRRRARRRAVPARGGPRRGRVPDAVTSGDPADPVR